MSRMAPQDRPRAAHSVRTRTRSDPHGRLLRRLLEMAGPRAYVLSSSSRPWASATFQGSRHEAVLRFLGTDAGAVASAMAERAPEAEFVIAGHIVADVSIDGRDATVDPEGVPHALLSLSALIIEDW